MASGALDEAEMERAREAFQREVRRRFEGAPIEKIELLQYGDDPEIEPGELLGRVTLAVPDGEDGSQLAVRKQVLDSFHDAYEGKVQELGKELRGRPGGVILEVVVEGQADDPEKRHGPHIKLKLNGGRGPGPLGGDPSLTPVMARVGPEELETLDTLIAVGIAGSRSEAVRWALARIRERPAYEQIRAHSRQIDDLKSQF
jgi:hypothetical protein